MHCLHQLKYIYHVSSVASILRLSQTMQNAVLLFIPSIYLVCPNLYRFWCFLFICEILDGKDVAFMPKEWTLTSLNDKREPYLLVVFWWMDDEERRRSILCCRGGSSFQPYFYVKCM